MSGEQDEPDSDLEALLRRAGTRTTPPRDAQDEVRRAVHAEWRNVVNARRHRRRALGFGIAATAAAVTLAVTIALRPIPSIEPAPVAMIERIEGDLAIRPTVEPGSAVQVGQRVMTGQTLSTSHRTRVALKMGDSISLRLDADTTLAVLAQDRVELRTGTVYVDTGGEGHQALGIETRAGNVSHLGTQYQVRSQAGDLTLSVREGRVQLASRNGTETAHSGEKLVVSAGNEIRRETIAPNDPSWAWTTQIAPPFRIENQPLTAFLQWAARETGRTLVYASPDVEASAATVTLQGSIANLMPDAALAAVLSTTQFERFPTEEKYVGIRERRTD